MDESWDRPYSKMQAAYPNQPEGVVPSNKYWPSVNRIDNVYGDRNLFCACPSIESYE
jgi:glycine dehydrogenase